MDYTAANLKARCEQGRDVGEPTTMWLSVTGEHYVFIGSQFPSIPSEPGTVDEGAEREWAFDAETAYYMALNCFENYAHDKAGKLYWRWGPEFRQRDDGRCMFYIRCLISDKPALPKDDPRVISYWRSLAEKKATEAA